MEEWKKTVLVGVILIILALMFGAARNKFDIWVIAVIIVAVLDILIGLYRKKIE